MYIYTCIYIYTYIHINYNIPEEAAKESTDFNEAMRCNLLDLDLFVLAFGVCVALGLLLLLPLLLLLLLLLLWLGEEGDLGLVRLAARVASLSFCELLRLLLL